jgi:hypothetical protein
MSSFGFLSLPRSLDLFGVCLSAEDYIYMAKKTTKGLNLDQLRHMAKLGAEATLMRLRTEIVALENAFPELSSAKGRQHSFSVAATQTRRMSKAARKAVSERMTRYWAERRKAKAKLLKKG